MGISILSVHLAYGNQAGDLALDHGNGADTRPAHRFVPHFLEVEIEDDELPGTGQPALIPGWDRVSHYIATPDDILLTRHDLRPNNSAPGWLNRLLRRRADHSQLARFLVDRRTPEVPPDRAKPAEIYVLNTNIAFLFGSFDGELSVPDTSWEKFEDSLSGGSVWDGDPPFANYVMHPLTGMISYQSAREANWNPWESFLFNIATTLVWEFVQEPWFGHAPSNQDMITTGLVGSVLGELGHIGKQAIDRRVHSRTKNFLLSVLVYPGGMINHGWDGALRLWCYLTENPRI